MGTGDPPEGGSGVALCWESISRELLLHSLDPGGDTLAVLLALLSELLLPRTVLALESSDVCDNTGDVGGCGADVPELSRRESCCGLVAGVSTCGDPRKWSE